MKYAITAGPTCRAWGSNPNAAKIALRQAHKLMEAYNLQADDIPASIAGELTIEAGSIWHPTNLAYPLGSGVRPGAQRRTRQYVAHKQANAP